MANWGTWQGNAKGDTSRAVIFNAGPEFSKIYEASQGLNKAELGYWNVIIDIETVIP